MPSFIIKCFFTFFPNSIISPFNIQWIEFSALTLNWIFLNDCTYTFSPIKRTHSHIGSLSHEKSTSAFRPLICILLIFEFLTVYNSTRVNFRLAHTLKHYTCEQKARGIKKSLVDVTIFSVCMCITCAILTDWPRFRVNVAAATVKIYVFMLQMTFQWEANMKSFAIFR